MTGANGYLGGWLDRRAGVIDPARANAGAGARSRPPPGARIAETPEGHCACAARQAAGASRPKAAPNCRAKAVVVATNAYSDGLIPGLAADNRPAAFLPDRDRAACRRSGAQRSCRKARQFRTSRRILVYYRRVPMAGWCSAGAAAWPCRQARRTGRISSARMLRLYPALAGVAIEKRWFGRVAMTPDHLPHIHEPEPGLVAVVGCQGRGVGLMTALGERIAAYLVERRPAGDCRFRSRRSGRSRSTPSGRSALPRRSPGTACWMHSSADLTAQHGISLTVSRI